MKKKLFSLALALALCLGLTVPAFAAELKLVEHPIPPIEGYEDYVGGYSTKNYYFLGEFVEGLAQVSMMKDGSVDSSAYGAIDKTGKVVIKVKYDYVSSFSEGFARVKNNKYGFVDKTGKEITAIQYTDAKDFSGGFAAVQKDGKWGYIDKLGEEVIPCAYDDTTSFYDGLAAVKKGSKWGFIDKAGREVIPFRFDDVHRSDVFYPEEPVPSFSEGLGAVKQGGKWGYIGKTGEEVIPCQYDDAAPFSEGLAAVKQGGKWGYIDRTGKVVIDFQFDDVYRSITEFHMPSFSEGLAAVKQGGLWGYIDRTGKLVIPYKYICAGPFSNGFAAVSMKRLNMNMMVECGIIDKTGKEVVKPGRYTKDGQEQWLEPASAIAVPIFKDGCMVMSRSIPFDDDTDKYFYYALTVDANVSDWAREQVDSAAANGLMPDGLGDDFTAKITRAEFAALSVKLYEAMGGYENPTVENPFSDTTDPVVLRANALGIVKGADGKFRPDDLVSREEAAVMLSRVYTKLGGEVPEVTATGFADDSAVSTWAKSAVAFMADKGIINGKGNNTFDPNGATGNASIEEAMVIALRMFEKLK